MKKFIVVFAQIVKCFLLLLFLQVSAYKSYGQTTLYYNDLEDLVSFLKFHCDDGSGTITIEEGNNVASSGDVISPGTPNLTLNLDDLSQLTSQTNCTGTIVLPLIIPSGVTLEGDFDLVNNPEGTLIYSENYRLKHDLSQSDYAPRMFLFHMEAGETDCMTGQATVIRKLRLRGPSKCWQEFNAGYDLLWDTTKRLYVGSIDIPKPKHLGTCDPCPSNECFGTNYLIESCEIFGFSLSGIFTQAQTSDIIIRNCFVHHINGISYNGIGYGIYTGGSSAINNIAAEVQVLNNIFDDCKDAFDGSASSGNASFPIKPLSWTFTGNTLMPFAGGINRHNSNGQPYFDHAANCFFFDRPNVTCINNNLPFPIQDKSPGDVSFSNSIFHKGSINVNYPGENYNATNYSYNLTITNNTFQQAKDPVDLSCPANPYDLMHGYARVADNYIENCTWDAETTSGQFLILNNSFNYKPGIATVNSPQPPELSAEVKDNSGNSLPSVINDPETKLIDPATPFKVDCSPGALGSTNLTYVIRPNPSNNVASGNNNSANNLYYDEQKYSSGSNIVTTSFSGYNQAGLYGVDIMSIDVDGSPRNLFGSVWHHYPVIVKPSDEQLLIFNIKDSYQEFHHNTLCVTPPCTFLTGVYKQVELNGNLIWQEDISEGGDGWERVEIDLKVPNPWTSGVIPLTYINTNGEKNVLSFSINIDPIPSMDVRQLSGLLVWIDNVYIKKYQSPSYENLINDGTVEKSDPHQFGPAPVDQCKWYLNNYGTSFDGCTALGFGTRMGDNGEAEDEFDAVTGSGGPKATAYISSNERKSGSQAIMLKLPRLDFDTGVCENYDPVYDSDPLTPELIISACTDIDFTDLLSCADLQNPPFSFTDLSTQNLNTTYQNQNFYIDNDLTIPTNSTLILEGCNLVIIGDKKIIIQDQAALEISKSTGTPEVGTRLFACGDMWHGIIVESGGTFKTTGGVNAGKRNIIEDVETSIYASGNNCTLHFLNTDFDYNFKAISLENGSFPFGNGTNETYIQGCRFKCTGGVITKTPHAGQIVAEHIQLNNVSDLLIGNASQTTYLNTFSDAVFGIISYNSSFDVKNNSFANIVSGNVHSSGCDIYAANNNGTSTIVNIGGAAANEKNYFSTSPYAIFFRGNINTSINNNSFNTISTRGIFIINNINSVINITDDNDFSGVNTGIFMSNVLKCTVNIGNNTFSNTGSQFDPALPFYNTAVTIQNVRGVKSSTVKIYSNTITDNRIGIHAENMYGIRIGGYDITTGNPLPNIITYNLNTNPLSDVFHGIWLQSCDNADVLANTVTNDVASSDEKLRGIVAELSKNANIGCNTLTNLGRAMRFEGDCTGMPGTELKNNVMNEYEEAIEFENAKFPTQGEPDPGNPNIGVPWDNVWNHSDPTNHWKVLGSLNPPTQIVWYHQGPDDPNNPFSPNPYDPSDINPKPNQNSGNLPCENSNLRGDFDRDARFGVVVGDSAIYIGFDDEMNYSEKTSVFETLKQNDSLLTLGLPTDASFQQFYSDMSETNIGTLSEVQTAIDSNQIDTAAVINESVNDTNSIEYCRKAVNSIITEKILNGIPLNAADTATLEYVFNQHWITAGTAVYDAAVILHKEYHAPAISLRVKKSEIEKEKQKYDIEKIKVYPNPANEKLFISGLPNAKNDVEIYDCYCRLVYKKSCELSHLEINLSLFANGVYNLKIKNNFSQYFKIHFAILK